MNPSPGWCPDPQPPTGPDVSAAVERARRRIADAGGDPAGVRIVAVTKGFGPDAVSAAARAGIFDIGENYAQELVAKHPRVGEAGGGPGETALRWHFLGRIQRNKVAALAPLVSWWESVARLEEGEAIARRAPGATVLVEVETRGSAERNGCTVTGVPELVDGLRQLDLDVRGLMTVAPIGPDARTTFATVRGLADRLGLPERSMGMSDDLELAVAEGSTVVRLGRALFGDRPAVRWRPR